MSSPDRSLLADLQKELRFLAADVQEMVQLRWELARLELQADLRNIKRLVIFFCAAAVMILTALPLLVSYLAEKLDGWQGIARGGWLLIFGLVLLGAGAVVALGAWIWFRRRFLGLQESLEELREDLEWMKESMKKEG
jgi:uncharacterized membrane protein YqjE